MAEFLVKQGGKSNNQHHDAPSTIGPHKKPIYTVTREPLSHLASWYHHFNKRMTMLEFILHHDNGWNFRPMNMYAEAVEKFGGKVFKYEDGLESIAEQMGFRVDEPLEVIGQSEKGHEFTDVERVAAQRKFAVDFEFYAKWT